MGPVYNFLISMTVVTVSLTDIKSYEIREKKSLNDDAYLQL